MSSLPEGTQIGAYRVGTLLGKGGMGAVYEATHSEINRKVAVKVLHARFAEKSEFKARFTNEAKIANLVEHPGLVQIFDYGQLPDGAAYLVMEYLKGETLGARIKRCGGILPSRDALRLAHLIADSLEAAHSKGVLHRDLKPDNVMIVPDRNVPGGERTKLLDFGIAKLADGTDAAPIQTETGAIMGTPPYMSPEQCRGLRDLDGRTDVYSFGAMLYVMLSGKPPFQGTQMEVITKHLMEVPPPLESMAPNVSPRLAALALRMLAKDKASRPSMHEVVSELETMLDYRPVPKSVPEKSLAESDTVALPPERVSTVPGTVPPTEVRTAVSASPSRKPLLVPVGATALAVLLAAILLLALRPAPKPTESPPKPTDPPPKPMTVLWTIASEPSGARVIREADGKQLCVTPCTREQPIGDGVVEVQLQKAGYAEAVLQLPSNASAQRQVRLEKLPPGPQPKPIGGKGPSAGSGKGKTQPRDFKPES